MTTKLTPEQIREIDLLESFLERTWDIGIRNERFHIRSLREAFSWVQDRTNWKLPVHAIIEPKDRLVVEEAIVFFTGSVPRFTELPGGQLYVQAAGYYEAIGA